MTILCCMLSTALRAMELTSMSILAELGLGVGRDLMVSNEPLLCWVVARWVDGGALVKELGIVALVSVWVWWDRVR